MLRQWYDLVALGIFLLFAVPGCSGLSLLAYPILKLLSTPEIARLGSLSVPLIASGLVVHGVAVILGRAFILHKDTKTLGMTWLVAAASNVVLNAFMVPSLGIMGAALATLMSYCVALILIITLGADYSEDMATFPWIFTTKSLISSAGMLFIVHFIGRWIGTSLIPLLVSIATGAVAYFALMGLLHGLESEEVDFIKGLLSSRDG